MINGIRFGDWKIALMLSRREYSAEALIGAALLKTTSEDTEKIKMVWPELYRQVYDRYNNPGGYLDKDEVKKNTSGGLMDGLISLFDKMETNSNI